MTERIEKLISLIPKCEVFADIGCDHGYVSKGVLDNGIASKVIVSDVSEKCLEKARALLSDKKYEGRVTGVVSDGFTDIPYCDTALIAGMGGEEIVKIITEAKNLPENLVLQPMKNCDKVRKTVVIKGYKTELDKVFLLDGKYYDFIVLSKGEDSLSEDEILFGRTNIRDRHKDFTDRLSYQKKLIERVIEKGISEVETKEKKALLEKINKYV